MPRFAVCVDRCYWNLSTRPALATGSRIDAKAIEPSRIRCQCNPHPFRIRSPFHPAATKPPECPTSRESRGCIGGGIPHLEGACAEVVHTSRPYVWREVHTERAYVWEKSIQAGCQTRTQFPITQAHAMTVVFPLTFRCVQDSSKTILGKTDFC